MSKHNKVNKSNYDQGGRLTPDDMARERKRQAEVSSHAKVGERISGKAPAAKGGERISAKAPLAKPPAASAKATVGRGGGRGASRPRSAPEE